MAHEIKCLNVTRLDISAVHVCMYVFIYIKCVGVRLTSVSVHSSLQVCVCVFCAECQSNPYHSLRTEISGRGRRARSWDCWGGSSGRSEEKMMWRQGGERKT